MAFFVRVYFQLKDIQFPLVRVSGILQYKSTSDFLIYQ